LDGSASVIGNKAARAEKDEESAAMGASEGHERKCGIKIWGARAKRKTRGSCK
jgi:hypothetical protein